MSYINPKHWAELCQSAISRVIARLNFESIDAEEAYSFLVQNPQRRNDGRLTDRYLKLWHEIGSGWKFVGHDPIAGAVSTTGVVKPDVPRFSIRSGKLMKYEQVHGVTSECFYPRVNYGTALEIATKQGQEASYLKHIGNLDLNVDGEAEDINFWSWVKCNTKLYILITEGTKKVSCLISCGFLAIALPGIYGGYRVDYSTYKKVLVKELQLFCHKDREFIFALDQDEKPSTIRRVKDAIAKTAALMRKAKAKTSNISWKQPFKGVDDLIHQIGTLAFDSIVKTRVDLEYKIPDLSQWSPTKVHSRYLDVDTIRSLGNLSGVLLAIKSAKGTGKTESIAHALQSELNSGRQALVITHRIQLARILADRIGIAHIDDAWIQEAALAMGIACCVDSLHPNSKVRFMPDNWDGCIVIIDEVEQLLWHLLNSNTLLAKRTLIIEMLTELIKVIAESGGTLIIADADLSSTSIKYFENIISGMMETKVIENTFVPNAGKRQLHLYQSDSELLLQIKRVVEAGDRIIIHTTSQRAKSKYSAQNLEIYLKKLCPTARIVVIDSVTVANKNHSACGALANLNQFVVKYDIVIATPTIETGVSIDVKYFDAVYSFANGVQTVDSVCQTLERVRADVPRHIAISTGGIEFIGDGSCSAQGLLKAEKSKANLNMAGLGRLDVQIYESDSNSGINLATWAIFAAQVNKGFKDYKENIIRKLVAEGYEIGGSSIDLDGDRYEMVEASDGLEIAKNENYEVCIQRIVAQDNPNDFEYQTLKKKTAKTQEERDREAKGRLTRQYLTLDITPEIVVKDENGWHSFIGLFYYLTVGNKYLKGKDAAKVDSLTKVAKEGSVAFLPDFNRSCSYSKVQALKAINIEQFFDTTKLFMKDGLQSWFDKLLECRVDIKRFLNVQITPAMNPIQAVQALLATLGYRLSYNGRRRVDGELVRFYSGVDTNFDDRMDVLDRWLVRDSVSLDNRDDKLAHSCSTSSIYSSNPSGSSPEEREAA